MEAADAPVALQASCMNAFMEYRLPDTAFWTEYERLWDKSISRSAFQSPQFIHYVSSRHRDDLAVFQCRSGETLKGVAFFKKENGVYQFLSDFKSDHNFFVLDRDCSGEEVSAFFEAFFRCVRRDSWKLRLQKKPADVPYLETMMEKAALSGLFLAQGKQAVCPMLRQETPEALSDSLCKSKKAMRNIKALSKLSEPSLEVLRGDEYLEAWVGEFCDLHVKRWQGTPTPSAYETPESRPFLIDCMRAWIRDGVLIRFSLRLGTQRVAYCWGFIQEQTFIAHAQAYDVAYSRNSPVKVLINFIGQWIRDQQINTMDFGYGSDEYKYDFANHELELRRISISGRRNLPFILREKLTLGIRQNRPLYRFLRAAVKPFIRKIYGLPALNRGTTAKSGT